MKRDVDITKMMAHFKNTHLSVSRIKLYESCPRAFYFKYVEKGPTQPGNAAARFGVVLHAVLERLYRWIIDNEYSGLMPEDLLKNLYWEEWQKAEIVGVALYQEGLQLLRAYRARHITVSHWEILDAEREFNITVGEFLINGYIDQVRKVDDETVEIIDYKSNRSLFTADELETDLQLSIYGLVARQLYPWAKRVRFTFHMLRHNTEQPVVRTAETIDDAAGYIIALGRRSESDETWTPKVSPLCAYCDHRFRCSEYEKLVTTKHEITRANKNEIWSVVTEYEALHKLVSPMYARKKELEDVIKEYIEREGDFEAQGCTVKMVSKIEDSYPFRPTVAAFQAAGVPLEEIKQRLLRVDTKAVESLREETVRKVPFADGALLKVTLESTVEKRPGTPRLEVRAGKKVKKV